MSIRPVKRIVQSTPTTEGAGVKLNRAFGFGETSEFDPFLLLDDFRNDRPDDYQAPLKRRTRVSWPAPRLPARRHARRWRIPRPVCR